MGPGRYDWDVNKIRSTKSTDFTKSKGDRSIFAVKDTPGPGSYQDDLFLMGLGAGVDTAATGPMEAKAYHAASLGKRSKSARPDPAFKSGFDRFKTGPASAPGPGYYKVPEPPKARSYQRAVPNLGFGSTTRMEYEVRRGSSQPALGSCPPPHIDEGEWIMRRWRTTSCGTRQPI